MQNKRLVAGLLTAAIVFVPIAAQADTNVNRPQSVVEQTTVGVDEVIKLSDSDIRRIARTLYGECRCECVPTAQKAAVVWCILNRLESGEYGDSISEVVVYDQFHGYKRRHPVLPELEAIVRDVVARWELEQQGVRGVGRTLPPDYYFFRADGNHGNVFRKAYKSKDCWDWEWPDPYADGELITVTSAEEVIENE